MPEDTASSNSTTASGTTSTSHPPGTSIFPSTGISSIDAIHSLMPVTIEQLEDASDEERKEVGRDPRFRAAYEVSGRYLHIQNKPSAFKPCPHTRHSGVNSMFPGIQEGCDPESHEWTKKLQSFDAGVAYNLKNVQMEDPMPSTDLLEESVEPQYRTRAMWSKLRDTAKSYAAIRSAREEQGTTPGSISKPSPYHSCNEMTIHEFQEGICHDLASHEFVQDLVPHNIKMKEITEEADRINQQIAPPFRSPYSLLWMQGDRWLLYMKDMEEPEPFTDLTSRGSYGG